MGWGLEQYANDAQGELQKHAQTQADAQVALQATL